MQNGSGRELILHNSVVVNYIDGAVVDVVVVKLPENYISRRGKLKMERFLHYGNFAVL